MKNIALIMLVTGIIYLASCNKDDDEGTDKLSLLTTPTWIADSLLVNGVDGSNGLLADFAGEAKFNKDGTGTFGSYTGTWRFQSDETQIVINSDSLLIPLTTKIVELTKSSLKIETSVPDPNNLPAFMDVRLTFKPKQ